MAKHSLKVGDILRCSWGYDQTNIDYYEVVSLNGETMVTIREIAAQSESTAWLQGNSVPSPGRFIGKPMRRKVFDWGKTVGVSINSFSSAYRMEPVAEVAGVKVFESSHWTAYA